MKMFLHSYLAQCVIVAKSLKDAGFIEEGIRHISMCGDVAFKLQCDDRITLDELYEFLDIQNAKIRDL